MLFSLSISYKSFPNILKIFLLCTLGLCTQHTDRGECLAGGGGNLQGDFIDLEFIRIFLLFLSEYFLLRWISPFYFPVKPPCTSWVHKSPVCGMISMNHNAFAQTNIVGGVETGDWNRQGTSRPICGSDGNYHCLVADQPRNSDWHLMGGINISRGHSGPPLSCISAVALLILFLLFRRVRVIIYCLRITF